MQVASLEDRPEVLSRESWHIAALQLFDFIHLRVFKTIKDVLSKLRCMMTSRMYARSGALGCRRLRTIACWSRLKKPLRRAKCSPPSGAHDFLHAAQAPEVENDPLVRRHLVAKEIGVRGRKQDIVSL